MEYASVIDQKKGLQLRPQNLHALYKLWRHRYRSRKHLHEVLLGEPERLHYDLGLSTEAALAEINKPFWRQ